MRGHFRRFDHRLPATHNRGLGVSRQCGFLPGDIKTARKKVGLSRDAFARTFGLSPATLRKWENGERQPTGAARVLLTIISREPEAALRAIR
jgi:DNA-binding transcriptional regulator YiaG